MVKKVLIYSAKAYKLFNPESKIGHGGAEVFSYNLAKELDKDKSIEVKVLVNKDNDAEVDIWGKIRLQKVSNLSVSTLGKINAFINLYAELEREVMQSDIVFQAMFGIETWMLSSLCKKHNKPFYYFVVGDRDVNGEFKRTHKWVNYFFEQGLKDATGLICQTQWQRDYAEKFNYNCIIFPNSIEVKPYPKISIRKHYLWVGRLCQVKQPEYFLEIAKANPDENFKMIGTVNKKDEYSDIIIRKAKAIKNLEYVPYIERESMDYQYERALYLINTSKFEGFPCTFLEAGANGCPVISLNWNSDNWIVKNCAGYVARTIFECDRLNDLNHFIKNKADTRRKIYSEGIYYTVKEQHDIKKNIKIIKRLIKWHLNAGQLRK